MSGVFIQTDSRGRTVLPGQKNKQFIMRVNEDGSIFLEPAVVLTQAQYEYDTDPALREMLARAIASPSVGRRRSRYAGSVGNDNERE
jgi:hypothetical protein